MIRISKSNFIKLFFLIMFVYCSGFVDCLGTDYYRVNSGQSKWINEYGFSRNVINSCLMDLYIPTKTSDEWTSFLNETLDCVNVVELDCSSLGDNWVKVPGNSLYGTNDFCVMKYEAKNIGGKAVSSPSQTPWVNINKVGASNECSKLGARYHLLSNAEWMTMVRNIENVSLNWADGVIGSSYSSGGGLFRGNVNTDASNSYFKGAVDFGAGRNIKARFYFSNSEQIWDLSGNVWEWLSNTIDCSGGYPCVDMPAPNSPGYSWNDFPSVSDYGVLGYDNIMPSNSAWGYSQGVGGLQSDSDGAYPHGGTTHGFLRGGSYGKEYNLGTGVFSLVLSIDPRATSSKLGFRCAYQ